MRIKWSYFLLFFLLFAFVGYFREKFFVEYNYMMYAKYYNKSLDFPFSASVSAFSGYNYSTLYYLKYLFTFLSLIIFAGLSFLSVKYILNEKKLLKWVIYSYVLLLTLAGLSMLFGYIVNQRLQDDEYTLSRWLVGIAQSPIITVVILASHQLLTQQIKPNK